MTAPAPIIAGRTVGGGTRGSEPVFDPGTNQVPGALLHATNAELDEALDAVDRAASGWATSPQIERARIIRRAAALTLEQKQAIGRLITLELGKPLPEARAEVETVAGMLKWNADEARRAHGRIIPGRVAEARQSVRPGPLGPIAGFAPWNAPAITPVRKLAGALAAACPIVFKPSEETPATALAIAGAMSRLRDGAGRRDSGLGDSGYGQEGGIEGTRAFSARVAPQLRRQKPSMLHAGAYSAVLHYLRAVKEVGSAEDGRRVVEQMKAMPTDDPLFGRGSIRPDGRVIHDMYLFQVKTPPESKGPWDYYNLSKTIPAAEAFRPMDTVACKMVRA